MYADMMNNEIIIQNGFIIDIPIDMVTELGLNVGNRCLGFIEQGALVFKLLPPYHPVPRAEKLSLEQQLKRVLTEIAEDCNLPVSGVSFVTPILLDAVMGRIVEFLFRSSFKPYALDSEADTASVSEEA